MKRLILTTAVLLLSTALASGVSAADYGRGRGHMMGGTGYYGGGGHMRGGYNYGGGIFDRLNLTDEQTAKIKTLREAHLKDVKPLQDKMFSKRGDLRLLWLQTNPDKDKILSLQKEIRELRDQMQEKATAHRADEFNVLTPEQQAKAQTALRRGPGQGPGRGPGRGMGEGGMMGPGWAPGQGHGGMMGY